MSERVTKGIIISVGAHLYTTSLPAGSLDYFLALFNKRYRSSGDSSGPTGQVQLQRLQLCISYWHSLNVGPGQFWETHLFLPPGPFISLFGKNLNKLGLPLIGDIYGHLRPSVCCAKLSLIKVMSQALWWVKQSQHPAIPRNSSPFDFLAYSEASVPKPACVSIPGSLK